MNLKKSYKDILIGILPELQERKKIVIKREKNTTVEIRLKDKEVFSVGKFIKANGDEFSDPEITLKIYQNDIYPVSLEVGGYFFEESESKRLKSEHMYELNKFISSNYEHIDDFRMKNN
ncbi:MAG: hypothetical protein GY714_09045 [Desulfobacterales bacterium]|nr:hypothetical protein [Desulfobacterales bacterium]